jgi:hypothetical protein
MRFVIFKSDVGDPNVVVTTEDEEKLVISSYKINSDVDLMDVDCYTRMVFAASHIEFELPVRGVSFACVDAKTDEYLEPVESNDDWSDVENVIPVDDCR